MRNCSAATCSKIFLQAWLLALRNSGKMRDHVSADTSKLQLTPEFANTRATELRRLHPEVHKRGNPEEQMNLKLFLEEACLRLRSFASIGGGGSSFANQKVQPDAVVKALLAAMNLRNRAQLGETFNLAFQSLFPGHSAIPTNDFKVLSAATLSQKQIEVDSSYCCFWRDRFESHKGPIYVYADSSPQAGSDYLLSIVTLIDDCKLPDCMQAACFLEQSVGSFQEAYAADDKDRMSETARQRHERGEFLKQAVHVHRRVPMRLGSRASSLDHKLRPLVRKFLG